MHDEKASAAQEEIQQEEACVEPVGVTRLLHHGHEGLHRVQDEQHHAHHAPDHEGLALFGAARHEARRYHCKERRYAAPCQGTKPSPRDFDANVHYGDASTVEDLNRVLWCNLWMARGEGGDTHYHGERGGGGGIR